MKIEQLTISNFRCFGPDPVSIEFGPCVTAFVGNNGSGKTAVLAALGRLFGVSPSQRSVRKGDFHVAKDRDGVERDAKLVIDCVLGFPDAGEEGLDAGVPEVFGHMAVAGPGEPMKLRIRLEATWSDDLTSEGVVEEDIRWVPAIAEDYVWETCQRIAPLERGLIQLIYVPASRNAADPVTSLLKGRLWRAARWSEEMTGSASEAGTALQALFDREAPSRFIAERLERRWDEVHRGDTTARPVLRLVENQLEDLVRQAEFVFLPDETGHARHLHELSDGQRSLFHIALTAATLEIERDAFAAPAGDGPFERDRLRRTYLTLLAIEEPENSLSPFFLARIMSQARDIGGMVGAQVIVSSHSPSILGRVDPEEVRYARMAPETRTSSIRSLSLPSDDVDAAKFVRLAVKAYPELYFARFVILAEGESEAIVLPRIARAMGVEFDRSFVPIVPLGGRFVKHFWKLLNDLDIPHATLLDLDLGRQHGGAKAIEYIVGELEGVDRNLADSFLIEIGLVDPAAVAAIDEAGLVAEGSRHDWLQALSELDVFFSWPVDLDFAMLMAFPDAYMRVERPRRGPRRSPEAVSTKRNVTLKTDGKPALYEGQARFDAAFVWYPYLFLGESKPVAHLYALGSMEDAAVAAAAPPELRRLVEHVRGHLA
ncbi:ATP-dependent nuclease [Methylorubrum extorquens]|uniref:ATP-dependent nuclease n=1 Tax=Methylorubrum extorquens TaxID=408 RepID=UPI0002EAB1D9|nr:AAA family ATPase [Methylorubrum extorquens]MCP1541286.1 energy-coupling factor transporter ATP-binding protein EcfA2 [Methylorubrum extorquens]MCP1586177.1 energy-coupling factor transporter ATP-binding protein EcfA2 [Methylorubrum extorquens]